MSSKKIAVIFDTNSYRKLANCKSLEEALEQLKEIITLEKKKDIQTFGSVIVGMELLANLVEGENGFNYKDCLTGTILLANHCNDLERNATRFIPHVPLLLEYSLFGEVISSEVESNVLSLAGTVSDFRDDFQKAIAHHIKVDTFERIKLYLDLKEEEFAHQVQELINGAKKQIIFENPSSDEKVVRTKTLEFLQSDRFLKMMSMAVVKAIFINAKKDISDEELNSRGTFLRDYYPLTAGFYQWVCFEVYDKKIDLQSKTSKNKRWNWLWDYNVSFSISNSTISGREVILVTSDKDLTRAINDHGFGNRVMTLEEYLVYLKTN
jgi:hypothetical protein